MRDQANAWERARPHIESPSGIYVAGKSSEPSGWVIELQGRGGHRFREETGFSTESAVFWDWDDQDRLWLFRSDDRTMRFWERSGDAWKRTVWDVGYGDTAQMRYLCGLADSSPSPAPPPSLFPFGAGNATRAKMGEKLGEPCPPLRWEY